MGTVTLRQSLAHSLNVATVKLAQMVGYKAVVDMARRAGLNNISPTPAIALGAYEATPLEIAGAYTIFADGGNYVSPPYWPGTLAGGSRFFTGTRRRRVRP